MVARKPGRVCIGVSGWRYAPWRVWVEKTPKRRPRHALEVRHESFVTPEFIALLRRYKVALVCADSVEWPRLMDLTSDFVYCQLHGSWELYASGYDGKSLGQWARWVAPWARGGVEGRTICERGHGASPRAPRCLCLFRQ